MSKKDGEKCYNDIDCESNLCVANICTQQSDHINIEKTFATSKKDIEEKEEELENQIYELSKLQKQMEELEKKKAELNEKKKENEDYIKNKKERKKLTEAHIDLQRRKLEKKNPESKNILSEFRKREQEEYNKDPCIVCQTKFKHTDNKITCSECGQSVCEKCAYGLYDSNNLKCPGCRNPYEEEVINSFNKVLDKEAEEYENARRDYVNPPLPTRRTTLNSTNVFPTTVFEEINYEENFNDIANDLDNERKMPDDDGVSTVQIHKYVKGRHPYVRNIHRYQEIEIEVNEGRLEYVGPKYKISEKVKIVGDINETLIDPREPNFLDLYHDGIRIVYTRIQEQQRIQQYIQQEQLQQQQLPQPGVNDELNIQNAATILDMFNNQNTNTFDFSEFGRAIPLTNNDYSSDDEDARSNASSENSSTNSVGNSSINSIRSSSVSSMDIEDHANALYQQRLNEWDSATQRGIHLQEPNYEGIVDEITEQQRQHERYANRRQQQHNILYYNLTPPNHDRFIPNQIVDSFVRRIGYMPTPERPYTFNDGRVLIGFETGFGGLFNAVYDNTSQISGTTNTGGKRKTKRKNIRKTKKGKKSKKTKCRRK